MDIEGNWARIRTHRERLSDEEIQGIAEVLFRGQELWLEEKLRAREDSALVVEFIGCQGKSGSEKAAEILLKLLETGEEALQIAAAEALKACPPGLVTQPLARIMLKQNQSSVKAGEIISSFGYDGAGVLRQLWFGADRTVGLRSQILQLLAETEDHQLEPLAFLAFISDKEDLIRSALKAAEKVEAKCLWGNIAESLANPSWLVRGRAVHILGKWRETRALPYLMDMGVDPDAWVEEERQIAMAACEI